MHKSLKSGIGIPLNINVSHRWDVVEAVGQRSYSCVSLLSAPSTN